MRANSSRVASASSSGKSGRDGGATLPEDVLDQGSRLAQGRACEVLDPIALPQPEALGWVTMDEFMNVYEGCGYDAACNHVPMQALQVGLTRGAGARARSEFFRDNGMTAADGATYAFSRRPLSRPYCPFIGRTLKGSKGRFDPFGTLSRNVRCLRKREMFAGSRGRCRGSGAGPNANLDVAVGPIEGSRAWPSLKKIKRSCSQPI